MTTPQTRDLAPADAAELIHRALEQASEVLQSGDLNAALDAYVPALGLALQLGPAPSEKVLLAVMDGARKLAHRQDADGLSALGPTLVDLVTQVREAGALPATRVMEAWATVASEMGALIGQVGLALAVAPDHSADMMGNAHARATLLDDATGGLFALAAWLEQLHLGA